MKISDNTKITIMFIITIVVGGFGIAAMCNTQKETAKRISDDNAELKFAKEANAFKYELIEAYDSLTNLQRIMINDLADEAWEAGSDLPQFDGDMPDLIQEQEEKIDSLLMTQL